MSARHSTKGQTRLSPFASPWVPDRHLRLRQAPREQVQAKECTSRRVLSCDQAAPRVRIVWLAPACFMDFRWIENIDNASNLKNKLISTDVLSKLTIQQSIRYFGNSPNGGSATLSALTMWALRNIDGDLRRQQCVKACLRKLNCWTGRRGHDLLLQQPYQLLEPLFRTSWRFEPGSARIGYTGRD